MTRKGKRRNNKPRTTRHSRNKGLGGNDSCSPLVKPGKFYGRDTRDSNHRSEDDVDEYNQEHSCVLSCQRPAAYPSSDEDVVLYQGRRFIQDHLGELFHDQLKMGNNHPSETLPLKNQKHLSSYDCHDVLEEKDVISDQSAFESGRMAKNSDTAVDDYIANLREFDETNNSNLLPVSDNEDLALRTKVVNNHADGPTNQKVINDTHCISHEYDVGLTGNESCARRVGYRNQNPSTCDLGKYDFFNHNCIFESSNANVVLGNSKKQGCLDNDSTSFAEENFHQPLSSFTESMPKSSNKRGYFRRNQSRPENWLLGNLKNPTKELLSDEELMDNDDIPLSAELDYIDYKFDELDLVDPGLEALLYSQWRLDRSKKARRKKEREELRAMGMLGRKHKRRHKESSNFTKQDLKEEVQLFLSSNEESKSLPPVGRTERKFVHELAHIFGLKSRSIGKGLSRHPIIYKTATSIRYCDGELEPRSEGLHRARRSYVPKERTNGEKDKNYRHRGGADRFSVGYKEGEIVGAAAPELAAENVGNQLMRKLGWKPGEALGAQNNKGILQPVVHVVKNTRVGLG